MFCVFGLIFDGTEGAESSFNVLQFNTRFSGTEGTWKARRSRMSVEELKFKWIQT
jgi:hypothetical protein